MMSERAKQLQRSICMTFLLLAEHNKVSPDEVDELYRQIIAHVHSARPHVLRDLGAKP